MCKIQYESEIEGKKVNCFATGFFCEIKDANIPLKKALFTNNHVLNEKNIEIGEIIIFEHLKTIKKIEITEKRRVFTNTELDYTCIEILDSDKINNFFKIEKTIFENKNSLVNNEIFILQYASGEELSFYPRKILEIENNTIKHSACTEKGSSGSPLIKRYKNMFIYGIHFGQEKEIINVFKFNLATSFDAILRDIKAQLNNKDKNKIKVNNNKINENLGLLSFKDNIINNDNNIIFDEKIDYRNEINLIYFSKEEEVKDIFGY